MHATPAEVCRECGSTQIGRYCPDCGQKRVEAHDLSLKHGAHDVVHELVHVDGRLWGTLWLLFARPGQLALDYVEGRRSRHVRPFRLFLVLSIAILFLQMNGPISLSVLLRDAPPAWHRVVAWGAAHSGMSETAYLAQRNAVFQKAMRIHSLYVATSLGVLFCFLLWRRRRRYFGEHAAFLLYSSSATHLASAAVVWLSYLTRQQAVTMLAGAAALTYSTVYLTLAARRFYGEGWGRTIWNVWQFSAYSAVATLGAFAVSLLLALPVVPYQRSKVPGSGGHTAVTAQPAP